MRFRVLCLTVACAWAVGTLPLTSETVGVARASGSGQPAAGAFATAPDQMLTADGVTLRYRELGSGDPVVLIHIGTRCKRAGMHWTVAGVDAIIALRCCKLSGRFEGFWERRAHQRAA